LVLKWFKKRGYRHLDVPVGQEFAKRIDRSPLASTHSFLPLLRYVRRTKRYHPHENKTAGKERTIMFPSHRDGCLLARYAHELGALLESKYYHGALSDSVIAYRKLGKGNYHFAREVLDAARAIAPCAILCFDVTKFFDTLDHGLLKRRLKQALGVIDLSKDWYAIFRQVTRFHSIELEDLRRYFPERFVERLKTPIATIEEVKAIGVPIRGNPDRFGIPQGTPISSVFSNLYMVDFDAAMVEFCKTIGGVYRRYCDDILVLCPIECADAATAFVKDRIAKEKIALNDDKTERCVFGGASDDAAQYLGFRLSKDGARLRESSLARQWRKLRRGVRNISKVGAAAIAAGHANKVFTKNLRKRFAALRGAEGRPVRNFSAYARRSAEALDAQGILRQVRRLERALEQEIEAFPKST
jgi:RNA-directed DNA polymerase